MRFLLFGVLCLSTFTLQILAEENDDSDQHPWSLVYTVYPWYNAEAIAEVWKDEKSVNVNSKIETTVTDNNKQNSNSDSIQHNNTNLQPETNVPYYANGIKTVNQAQSLKNGQQLTWNRNRHRNESSK